MRGSRSRAKARGRQSALVVKVKRGRDEAGQSDVDVLYWDVAPRPAWVFEDELDTVWAGTRSTPTSFAVCRRTSGYPS